MKLLALVIAFLAVLCLVDARVNHALVSNRTPKTSVKFNSVCDECEEVIKRFKDVAKDPAKLAELKVILSVLCHETSYEEECRAFVSKLDLFIDRLLPYMSDPEAVCKKLHLCSNPKLEQFHRVGLLYAKKYLNKVDGASDLICEECQFAAHELQIWVQDHENQREIRTFLSDNVCKRLGQYRGDCDLILDEALHELFQELSQLLANQRQFCGDLKLCNVHESQMIASKAHKSEHNYPAVKKLLKNLQMLKVEALSQPLKLSMSCFECRIMVDALLTELQTNSSVHNLAGDLRNGVCPRLPSTFLLGCTDFLNLYAPTVVYMTLQQFTSEQVCTAMHMCTNDSYIATRYVPYDELKSLKCDSCKGISDFLQVEMSKPAFRAAVIYDIRHYVCDAVPEKFFYICDNLAKGYVPLVVTKVLQSLAEDRMCRTLHAC
jgi:saposin